jgi:hypothetical protein
MKQHQNTDLCFSSLHYANLTIKRAITISLHINDFQIVETVKTKITTLQSALHFGRKTT